MKLYFSLSAAFVVVVFPIPSAMQTRLEFSLLRLHQIPFSASLYHHKGKARGSMRPINGFNGMKRWKRRRDGPADLRSEIITKEEKRRFLSSPSSSPRKLEKFLFEKSGKGVASAVACMERNGRKSIYSRVKRKEGSFSGKES